VRYAESEGTGLQGVRLCVLYRTFPLLYFGSQIFVSSPKDVHGMVCCYSYIIFSLQALARRKPHSSHDAYADSPSVNSPELPI